MTRFHPPNRRTRRYKQIYRLRINAPAVPTLPNDETAENYQPHHYREPAIEKHPYRFPGE